MADRDIPPHRALALVGPTAAGKSGLALRLASLLPLEIVSCDSLMVYIGMDIGTGKPTVAEQRAVPHHLLDVVAPNEPFHAARWALLARAAIRDITGRGRLPVIVGGTGLYLRALLGGLFEAPPPDEAIRQRHRDEAARDGSPALHARLASLDPETSARVDPNDLMRISRALEIFEQTGEAISVLQKRASPTGDVVCQTIVLDPPLERLRQAIGVRFDAMMATGLVDETRRLRETYGADPKPLQALGYRQMGDFLTGALPLDAAVVAAKAATAAYARRQRTFFRKLPSSCTCAWRPTELPEPAAVLTWWQAQATAG